MNAESDSKADSKVMLAFDPSNHPPQEIYKLLVGAVVPRPIAFVSTIDTNGVRNLAPFSFFTVASANPPILCFCVAGRPKAHRTKDTLRNIEETGEFVVNIVSEPFAEAMNKTAAEVAPEVDEFALAGLTPLRSELVRPPRVAESHVHMECRLRTVLYLSEEPTGGNLVLGDVLRFHVRESIFEDFRIDPSKLDVVGRMAGTTYVRTRDRFELQRPE